MIALEQAIRELRRPFTPDAVQFKIQTGNLIVCYIDARQTGERLNLVCPSQWTDKYEPVVAGPMSESGIACSIGISTTFPPDSYHFVWRQDVGISEGGFGGLKAVYSDAFKRAGVKWGIGASLYYTPRYYADKGDFKTYKGKSYITDKVRGQARKQYAEWLEAEGIQRFGPALDMGDIAGVDQGDVEVVPEGTPETPELEPETEPVDVEQIKGALKDYIARAPDTDKAAAEFKLWKNANEIPASIEDLSPGQVELTLAFLAEEEIEADE